MAHNPSTGDRRLAMQLAKTGNLLDLWFDSDWLESSARVEDECDGHVEAGLLMRDYAAQKQSSTPQSRQQMRLQSILFSELHLWMTSWGLGLSFEATYTHARQLIRQHLQHLSPEQLAWLDRLLTEDEQQLDPQQKPMRAQTIPWLAHLFTSDDWHALALTAAQTIANDILQISQSSQLPANHP